MTDEYSISQLPFASIIHLSHDAVMIARLNNFPETSSNNLDIIYVNPGFETLTGFAKADVIGQHPRIIFGGIRHSGETSDEAEYSINLALQQREPVQAILPHRAPDERQSWLDVQFIPVVDQAGILTHLAIIGRDITEQKILESHLEAIARTDSLTGVYNHRSFLEHLHKEWGRSQRYKTLYAILLSDINNFKEINDSYGHIVGDMIMRVFATHCQAQFRAQDVIGRISNDRFAILLPETDIDGAYLAAERLHDVLSNFVISTHDWSIKISLCIGIAQTSETDASPEEILHRAEQALNDARQKGKKNISRGEY